MFTRFVDISVCFSIEGKSLPEKDLEKVYTSQVDYVAVLNRNLYLAQVKGEKSTLQEDRVMAGMLPSTYYEQNEGVRHSVLRNCFFTMQQTLTRISERKMFDRGSTALLACTDGNRIDVSYLGDSLAILITVANDKNIRCKLLNPFFHHASNPEEKQRIVNAGGKVTNESGCERIDGKLMVSRALGNNRFNYPDETKNIVSREATCLSMEITLKEGERTFLLVASDGLTAGSRIPEEDYVTELLMKYIDAAFPQCLGKILDHASKVDQSKDDISVACIELSKGMTPTYTALFDGHGGPEISDLAHSLVDSILTQEYNMFLNILSQRDPRGGSCSTSPSPELDKTLPMEEDDPAEIVSGELSSAREAAKDPLPTGFSLKRAGAFYMVLPKRLKDPDDEDSPSPFTPRI